MALVLADRVQETTTTTGTGTITLAGAVAGFQSFSAIGNGNTTYYTISGGTEWEVGIGTYTSSGTTLSRDTVLASSAGGTTKVDFSAGTKDVFVTLPSQRSYGIPFSTQSTTYSASSNEGILANTSGAPFTITLPASPVAGTQVIVADAANTWGTNNLTLARNGSTIEGLAEDLVCDITGASVQLIYSGTTWQAFAQVGGAGGNVVTSVNASGGTTGLTFSGGPITSTGTLTLSGTLGVANGGTGATTLSANAVLLGNGTSALQTVAPGASGNILTSNGTTWTSATPAAGGAGWTLISVVTASNSATVDFTTGIGSTYDDYVVVADNLIAATNAANMGVQMYTAGAWITSLYSYNIQSLDSSSSTPTYTRSISAPRGLILPSLSDGSGGTFAMPGAFTAFFYDLNGTGVLSYGKPYVVNSIVMATNANSVAVAGQGGGFLFDGLSNSPAAVTGIRFLMSSGNITSGTFRLYGIQKS